MRYRHRRWLAAIFFAAACLPAYAQVSVFPASPKAQETVRVRVPGSAWPGASNDDYPDARQTRVAMAGNRITVSVVLGSSWGFPGPPPGLDLAVGQFPPGDYAVEVTATSRQGESLGSMGSAAFSVGAQDARRPLMNLTGLWWNAAESGWGINIVQNGAGTLFATWFLYGPDGKPIWYHMPGGEWNSAGGFDGPIYRTTGPYMDGCAAPPQAACPPTPFDPDAVTRTLAGTATFGFNGSNYDEGSVVFVIDAKRISKSLQRLSF